MIREVLDDCLVLDFVRLTLEEGFKSAVNGSAKRECRIPCVRFATEDEVIAGRQWTRRELFQRTVVKDEQEMSGFVERSEEGATRIRVRDYCLDGG